MLDRRAPAWASLPLVRSIARRALPGAGAVAVHASLVEVDGQGVVIAGWSESGKTEAALGLAARLGGRFISDKWVVLDGEGSWPHPGVAGLRDWVARGADAARLRADRRTAPAGRPVGSACPPAHQRPRRAVRPAAPARARDPTRARTPASRPGGSRSGRSAAPGSHRRPRGSRDDHDRSQRRTGRDHPAHRPQHGVGGSAAWFADELGTSIRVLERVVGTTAAHLIETPFPADPRAVAAVIAALR
jgi:hypothetical protein